MAEDNVHKQNTLEVGGFLALVRELQYYLYEMARQAELGGESSLELVQAKAEQSLKLIDSYILTSQVEIGQLQLSFSPYGVGAIMHEAAYDLRLSAGFKVDVKTGVNQPVMTHAEILKNLLWSSGQFISEVVKRPLELRSFAASGNRIGVGVFAKDFDISAQDLRAALAAGGRSHMPMAAHSNRSGAMLLIANGLAEALGGQLKVKRMGAYRGIVTVLPKSQQMALLMG